MKMIFLVDGDNNIGTGLQGADQLTADDSILIFYQKTGLALGKIKELCKGSKAGIQYLESVKGGKNSIDFQIITELGVLVGRGEADCAYVISQDKGYEAAMSALRARYAGAFREVALRPSIAACLKASYLLRAATLPQLETALAQEFGAVQGAGVFRHLQGLFAKTAKIQPPAAAASVADAAADPSAAEGTGEKPAAKKSRGRRRTSGQKDKAAEPAKSESPKPESPKPEPPKPEPPKPEPPKPEPPKPELPKPGAKMTAPKAAGKTAPKAASAAETADKPAARPRRSRRKKRETETAE